jgi:hypothetical protein
MPEVPGFEYDIFISYGHRINTPIFGIKWVTELKKELKGVLAATLDPAIWLSEDESRTRSGDWSLDVDSAVKSSAVLITINGPSWDDSGNCKDEKDAFEEEEEDPRTRLGTRRIIEVVHHLTVDGKSPSNLTSGDVVWFCPRPQEDPHGATFDPGSDEFRRGVLELSKRVQKVLVEMKEAATAVFLNPRFTPRRYWDPKLSIFGLHGSLRDKLGKQYRLIDKPAQASVSIHVLGKNNDPAVIAEFRRAKDEESGKPCIVILDPDMAKEDPDTRAYQEFERPNLDVYLGANKTNDETIDDVIKSISRLFPKQPRQTKVYVICSNADDSKTEVFQNLLEELKDYDDAGKTSPGNIFEFHYGVQNTRQNKALGRCDGALLVWQGGNSKWFRPQYLEELKDGERLRPSKNPIAAMGVCLMKPEPTPEEERKGEIFAQLYRQWKPEVAFRLINDLTAEADRRAAVQAFLKPLRERRAQRRARVHV